MILVTASLAHRARGGQPAEAGRQAEAGPREQPRSFTRSQAGFTVGRTDCRHSSRRFSPYLCRVGPRTRTPLSLVSLPCRRCSANSSTAKPLPRKDHEMARIPFDAFFACSLKRRAGLVLVAGSILAGVCLFRVAQARGLYVGLALSLTAGIAHLVLGRAMVVARGQLSDWLSPWPRTHSLAAHHRAVREQLARRPVGGLPARPSSPGMS